MSDIMAYEADLVGEGRHHTVRWVDERERAVAERHPERRDEQDLAAAEAVGQQAAADDERRGGRDRRLCRRRFQRDESRRYWCDET